MIYAYIRVSTSKQSAENQKYEIKKFCKEKGIKIDFWCEETISGLKKISDRKLGKLMNKLKEDDILIVTELSRLGRSLLQIMSVLNHCMDNNIRVFTVKEKYELGNNINSKVLAFAFSLSAEIERNLISDRTREALARKKAEGIVLGRPKGKKTELTRLKLYKHRNTIFRLRNEGVSYNKIAKKYNVNRLTVSNFIKRYNLESDCE